MKTCAISIQYCWSHLRKNESSIINIHTIVERTTQVITEAIKQACNGGQHSNGYLELRNVHIALPQLLEDITWRFSKSTNWTELLHCRFLNCRILEPTGKQPLWPHKILTKFWLAVWKWYNKFLIHKKWIDGITGGCSHQFSQSITYSTIRKVFQEEGDDSSQHFLLNNTLDNFTCKSSFHKIGWLSRTSNFNTMGHNS